MNQASNQPTNQVTVCLSTHPPTYLPIYLHVSTYLSISTYLLTYLPTYLPTYLTNQPTNSTQHSPPSDANSWSYSHEIPHIYANQMITTVFTKVRHMSLSFNKSSPLHPLMSIFTFSSHTLAGLQSGLSPSGFPIKILYTFLVYPIHCTCLSKGTLNEEHERHNITLMTQSNLT